MHTHTLCTLLHQDTPLSVVFSQQIKQVYASIYKYDLQYYRENNLYYNLYIVTLGKNINVYCSCYMFLVIVCWCIVSKILSSHSNTTCLVEVMYVRDCLLVQCLQKCRNVRHNYFSTIQVISNRCGVVLLLLTYVLYAAHMCRLFLVQNINVEMMTFRNVQQLSTTLDRPKFVYQPPVFMCQLLRSYCYVITSTVLVLVPTVESTGTQSFCRTTSLCQYARASVYMCTCVRTSRGMITWERFHWLLPLPGSSLRILSKSSSSDGPIGSSASSSSDLEDSSSKSSSADPSNSPGPKCGGGLPSGLFSMQGPSVVYSSLGMQPTLTQRVVTSCIRVLLSTERCNVLPQAYLVVLYSTLPIMHLYMVTDVYSFSYCLSVSLTKQQAYYSFVAINYQHQLV